ncbi:purarive Serine/threonine protein kinase [Schizophyllum commune H4-8]|nr:purarive Serine/threonine protein kinase [Schizophyllum commune H4-8]KAI5897860.1 purarive Serine/threonine protein kinase [Schizophyllum commune H4-8]
MGHEGGSLEACHLPSRRVPSLAANPSRRNRRCPRFCQPAAAFESLKRYSPRALPHRRSKTDLLATTSLQQPKLLQSRLARRLRGSLLGSAFVRSSRALVRRDRAHTETEATDDFQLVDREDPPTPQDPPRRSAQSSRTSFTVNLTQVEEHNPPIQPRPRSLLARIKTRLSRSYSCRRKPQSVVLEFPAPPTHLPEQPPCLPAILPAKKTSTHHSVRSVRPPSSEAHSERQLPEPQSVHEVDRPATSDEPESSHPDDFERVDPASLTASPSFPIIFSISRTSSGASFIPATPSWLSRNVLIRRSSSQTTVSRDIPESRPINPTPPSTPSTPGTPGSPPLPIPPKLVVTSHEDSPPLSPLDLTREEFITPRESFLCRSDSHRRSSQSLTPRVSRASLHIHRLSWRNSYCERTGIVHSELLLRTDVPSSHEDSTPSPTSDLTATSPTVADTPETPARYIQHRVYFPTPDPNEDDSPPHITLSPDLWNAYVTILSETRQNSPLLQPQRTMDFTGSKRNDVVDIGGDFDYSGMKWFQDAPPREAPPPPQAMYNPSPAVVEQNEAFEFALRSAPNVLYARYKQYGQVSKQGTLADRTTDACPQLGVLAWCSEFSELIDALKELGFQGNMFVATRSQALRTCEEIMRLKLDIEMQIIVMYLSSQVARLRRFLDSEGQWNDYPIPQFPLEPRQYT